VNRHRGLLAALTMLALTIGHSAQAQPAQGGTARPEPIPDTDYAPPGQEPDKPALRPATAFAMPDVPDEWNRFTNYDGRGFSARLTLAPLIDYTAFSQDDDSIEQVGAHKSQWDVRTFRIMERGRLKFAHPVDYFVSVEVKGRDHVQGDEDSKLGFTDWYVSTWVGRLGELRYGKVKEGFVYEVVGDAANLQQQERILAPAFVPTRNIGLRLSNTMAGDRMTWTAGWYNDWWTEDEAFDESGNQFGRITGLPYWANDGADYVHLGLSLRYTGANEGVLRFRARPESNTASYYVDTGDLIADHANETSVETIWGRGPFFVTSDVTRAWVDSPETGNPYLWGMYVAASYVLTGEHRPYDRKVGYARRLLPQGRWGAWEIVTRYSHLDLDDRSVSGGTLDKGTIGLNWWATRRWKLGFDYGLTSLDRAGVSGITLALHTRLQWIY
jgi:phosphate-selective porin